MKDGLKNANVGKPVQKRDAYDYGPCKDIEDLVGTKNIVKKYQKQIYDGPEPSSSSSEDHFSFSLTDEKLALYEKMMRIRQ